MANEEKTSFFRSHCWKIIGLAAGFILIFTIAVMLANYRFPAFFESQKPEKNIPGVVFTSSIITIGGQMFDNWLPNDFLWPTILLDNPQNFQIGQLLMLNYTVLRLRENLSRLRSSDTMDPNCSEAYTLLSNDPYKWILPSSESRFKKAIAELETYRANLESGRARFSPRADNLTELLVNYVSALGALNSELAKAPKELRLKSVYPAAPSPLPAPADPTNATAPDSPAPLLSDPAPEAKAQTQTPYRRVDDNFYRAQGAAYVLRQMLAAIRIDFIEILELKKATELVDDIILTLDQSQFEPWVVLNGDIGSLTANHSMELHSILENSRQKINNLIEMLSQ
ncbi:MAG: DUF2333 family protein [Deltaproteobacteria bacterium]|jgi:hypothetical protein|nr:DUF2333 family protein [Deltaproteobacteria bacterium]